ncbi:MAG: precorrin-3B C(17)-methyltransferase [Deltaproteobacteria bacterium]|nr:precorrin-3B C(17)-methyltransferase [Deltaproteobacteria bacterium]
MDKKNKGWKNNARTRKGLSNPKGALYIVGIGPGSAEHLTERARHALAECETIVGYTTYIELILPLVEDKKIFTTPMTKEIARCKKAIELASNGERVAIVSSGDPNIYGMAGLILELSDENPPYDIEVVPGVPAFVCAGALLGAPLMHDFASISLSDLLTPWGTIEKRLAAAVEGDFVIILYNPKSRKRIEGIKKAIDIISRQRNGQTPVGIVRNAAREDQSARIIRLSELKGHLDSIDMSTLVIIGNSTSFKKGGWFITPRGYNTNL